MDALHTVVYRAVADFRDLYLEVEKAKRELRSLKEEQGRINTGRGDQASNLARETQALQSQATAHRTAATEAERHAGSVEHISAASRAATAETDKLTKAEERFAEARRKVAAAEQELVRAQLAAKNADPDNVGRQLRRRNASLAKAEQEHAAAPSETTAARVETARAERDRFAEEYRVAKEGRESARAALVAAEQNRAAAEAAAESARLSAERARAQAAARPASPDSQPATSRAAEHGTQTQAQNQAQNRAEEARAREARAQERHEQSLAHAQERHDQSIESARTIAGHRESAAEQAAQLTAGRTLSQEELSRHAVAQAEARTNIARAQETIHADRVIVQGQLSAEQLRAATARADTAEAARNTGIHRELAAEEVGGHQATRARLQADAAREAADLAASKTLTQEEVGRLQISRAQVGVDKERVGLQRTEVGLQSDLERLEGQQLRNERAGHDLQQRILVDAERLAQARKKTLTDAERYEQLVARGESAARREAEAAEQRAAAAAKRQQSALREHPLLSVGAAFGSLLKPGFEQDAVRGLRRLTAEERAARKELSSAGGGGGGFFNHLLNGLEDFSSNFEGKFGKLSKILFSFRGVILLCVAALGPLVAALGALGGAAIGLTQAFAALVGNVALLPNLFLAAATGVGALLAGLSPLMGALKAYGAAQKAAREASANHAKALKDELKAQEQLDDARKQATRNLEDMKTAVDRINLSEQGGKLSVEAAKQAYQESLADANATNLDRQQKYLAYLNAQQDYADLKTKDKRLQEDYNTTRQRGVENDPSVLAAKDALATAQKATQTGSSAAATADAKYQAQLDQLGPKTRKVAEAIVAQADAWDQLKKSVGDRIFGPVADRQLNAIPVIFGQVKTALEGAGDVIGKVLSQGVDLLTRRRGDVDKLIDSNTRILEQFGKTALSLFNALLTIAVAAAPFAESLAKQLAHGAASFDAMIQRSKDSKLPEFFQIVKERTDQFLKIAKNIAIVFGALFFSSNDFAGDFMDKFVKITDHWAAWAKSTENAGSGFKQYLEDIKPLLSEIGHLIGAVATTFVDLAKDPRNIREAEKIFRALADDVLPKITGIFSKLAASGVVSTLVGDLGKVLGAVEKFLNSGGTAPLAVFAEGFTLTAGALLTIASIPGVPQLLSAVAVAVAALAAASFVGKFTGFFALVRGLKTLGVLAAAGGGGITGFLRGVGRELLSLTTLGKSGSSVLGDKTTGGVSEGKFVTYTSQLDIIIGLLRQIAAELGAQDLEGLPNRRTPSSTYKPRHLAQDAEGLAGDAAPVATTVESQAARPGLLRSAGGGLLRGLGLDFLGGPIAAPAAALAGIAYGSHYLNQKFFPETRGNLENWSLGGLARNATNRLATDLGFRASNRSVFDPRFYRENLANLMPNLRRAGSIASSVGGSIVAGAKDVGGFLNRDVLKPVEGFFTFIGHWFRDRLKDLGHFLEPVVAWLKPLKAIFLGIGHAFADLGRTVGRFFANDVGKPIGHFFAFIGKEIAKGTVYVTKPIYDHVLKPIGHFFAFIGIMIGQGAAYLGQGFYRYVLKPIGHFFGYVGTEIGKGTAYAAGWVYDNVLTPIGHFFAYLGTEIGKGASWIAGKVGDFFSSLGGFFANLPNELLAGFSKLPWIGKYIKAEAKKEGTDPTYTTGTAVRLNGYQSGGLVAGVFDGRTDTLSAWLTPGEWITRKRVVDKPFAKQLLADLNNERFDPAAFYGAFSAGLAVRPGGVYLPSANLRPHASQVSQTTIHRGVQMGDITIHNPVRERSEQTLRRKLQTVARRIDR